MKLPDAARPTEAQDEDMLLAMCVFGEARGEPQEAQQGVACVVRNRVDDPHRRYGHGWAGVILRPWQFSSFNANDPNRPKLLRPLDHERSEIWVVCWEIARKVYQGIESDNTQGATHYYDDSLVLPPKWARRGGRLTPTVKLGSLNFFREE
jgi:N-acetylmuramoyl-L-alanine amidase